MGAITIKGLKGLSIGMGELGKALTTSLFDRTTQPIVQEARQRLESDTPVVTGRLLRSTTVRKGTNEITLGQFAPYANVVNNRRGFWQGAIQIAQKWPPFYSRMAGAEVGIIARRYANQ